MPFKSAAQRGYFGRQRQTDALETASEVVLVEHDSSCAVAHASAGFTHTVVCTAAGEVYTSGDGPIGRGGPPAGLRLVAALRQEVVRSVAAGALHTVVSTSSGSVWEWGLLFHATRHADPMGARELVGISSRLERNAALQRVVLRSEAAYLA